MPVAAIAKDDPQSAGKAMIKQAKKGNDETKQDDKGQAGVELGDDKGSRLGLDDDVRNCFVYVEESHSPKPYQQYRSQADKARIEAETILLSLAEVVYADQIGQFHDLNDDSTTTFSVEAEMFRLRHRLGARGCAS